MSRRLLNAPAPGSEGQEGAGEGEARGQDVHTERTLVRLRALLTFYMQSEVRREGQRGKKTPIVLSLIN